MNPSKLYLTGVVCFFLCPAAVNRAHAITVTVPVSADTTLFGGAINSNLGGVDSLIAGGNGNAQVGRGLLRFNLAGVVPSNAIINSASLTLQVVQTPSQGALNSNFDLHRVLLNWGEGTKTGMFGAAASAGEATWVDRFFSQGTWTVPGAAAPGDFVTAASSTRFVSGLGGYTFTNLAADVQLWLNNPAGNFGWLLRSRSEDLLRSARRFGTREAELASERPVLTVDYTPIVTTTLTAFADTTLWELDPQNNLGAATLSAGKTGIPSLSRALMRFNLAAIPSDATVLSANLALTVVKVPDGTVVDAVNSNFELHRVNVSWTEGNKTGARGQFASSGETTWLNRAQFSTAWSAPGASAPTDYQAAVSSTAFVAGLGTYTFSGLAADVQTWVAAPASNFGWILINEDELNAEAGTARRFGNREDAPNAPSLTLSYVLPPAPPITSVDALGNTIRIHFTAQAGRPYVIECRTNLTATATICTNIPAQGATGPIIVPLPITGGQRFFRVGR